MQDEDDDQVWDSAVEGVKPIKKKASRPAVPARPKKVEGGFRVMADPPPPVKKVRGQGLDKRTDERLRKGQMRIEARIDLHGYVLAEAEVALRDFITGAYARQMRCVLVITGKGGEARDKPWYEGKGGTIRSLAPSWLGGPALKDMILKTYPAQPKDGGSGALYVLLRRHRH